MLYSFYVADVETTGLDSHTHDIIELSLLRLGDESENNQKTWCLKSINQDTITADALRINGHKLEDITWKTKEGRERYLEPSAALIEVENWLANDDKPAEKRFLIGQNVGFDRDRLEQLWIRCNSKDSFPFGRRMIDTMVVALMMDYVDGDFAEGYSLKNLIKKYGIKNTKAHTAASDVLATKELFEKQVEELRRRMNVG